VAKYARIDVHVQGSPCTFWNMIIPSS